MARRDAEAQSVGWQDMASSVATRRGMGCFLAWWGLMLLLMAGADLRAESPAPLELFQGARRVVFLGDSITFAGGYIADFEAWMLSERWERTPEVIDCGLPSETVSGLSEEGHAGGKFPRPDLAERLDRVLETTRPDLVVACYGINCGIYQPFDEERFARYQAGHRHLRERVERAGAKLIVVTPPFYDDRRSPRDFSYNEVLDRYSDWLLSMREQSWCVVDLHGPMTREVARRRAEQPDFTMQPDGVHPNDEGHWQLARTLIAACGDEDAAAADSPSAMLERQRASMALLSLVRQRMSVLRDAYVAAAGHKRPGVAAGLPLPEARRKAGELTGKIAETLRGE